MMNRFSPNLPIVVCLAGACLVGCYQTTIRSGRAPAPAIARYEDRWHHGLVAGIVELSGPYDLEKICPNGWAEITTETSFLNGLASAVTESIYAPQSVTIRCAEGPAANPEAPSEETEPGSEEEDASSPSEEEAPAETDE